MPRDFKNIRHFVVFLFLLSSLLLRIQATASFLCHLLGGHKNYFNQCVYALLVSVRHVHMYDHFSGLFNYMKFYQCAFATTRKKNLPHAYVCNFKWSFSATCANLLHYVVLLCQVERSYPCHLGLGLSDVSGYFFAAHEF